MGILGAVVVPQIIGRDDTARVQAAKTDIQRIGQALNMYRLDNFQYPSDEQGLEALVSEPSGFPEPKNYNPDGYLPKIPVDPWGTPYVYERVDNKFQVYSLGADGQEGGEGLNKDIRADNS